MHEDSPTPRGRVAPLKEQAAGKQRGATTGRLDLRRVAIKAGRQRRWQFDSRANGASRQSARALVWKFQSKWLGRSLSTNQRASVRTVSSGTERFAEAAASLGTPANGRVPEKTWRALRVD